MLGCFIGVLGKEKKGGRGQEEEKKPRVERQQTRPGEKRERAGEREGEQYRVKALSVSALRYVGTLLNPERLGEKCSTWQ